MLDTNLKQQLTTYLQNLTSAVELSVFLGDDVKSKELNTLVTEVAEMSALVSVVVADASNERVPSMLVRSVKTGGEMRFAGVPMGHEFTSLVLALLHSGGHPIKLDQAVIEQVASLEGEHSFETYISLSCQNCPDVVQALNMMAAINPQIKHVMVDGALFQEEVYKRDILSVPAVYLNGKAFGQGRMTVTEILNKVDTNAGARQAKAINNKEAFDLLVIGGGPAGASSAIYSARKGIRTGIVADDFGGQLQETMSIENFISVNATDGPKLAANLEAHVNEYDVDIMNNQQVKKIIESDVKGGLITVELESGAILQTRSTIIATGARWREMNVTGEQEYRGKGVAYCPHCDGPLFKGKSVAVIGGGNSGIEAAIDLAGLVKHVTVLEFDSVLRADAVLQNKARSLPNIEIIVNAQTTEVLGNGKHVTGLNYLNRATDKQESVELAGIFVQIGLVPNSKFLQGTVDLTERGEVIINHKGETNIAGVYAAGDVTNTPFKQIIIAMGSGATAALGAFDYLIRTPNPLENIESVSKAAA
ncbi:MAG: alkyl hydroperoxide reductase subunit F [Cognaticolwellia sp.]|jgi:alkyl hydroperoxide reductase subunit F